MTLDNDCNFIGGSNIPETAPLNPAKVTIRYFSRFSRRMACETRYVVPTESYLTLSWQDLSIEKQWRASLQVEIQREKDRVVELNNECKKYKSLKKVNIYVIIVLSAHVLWRSSEWNYTVVL